MGDDDVASEISASIRDSITHTEDMDNLVVEEMTPARDSGVVLIDDQSSTSEFCESQFTHEEFRPLTQTSGVSELKYREISPEKPAEVHQEYCQNLSQDDKVSKLENPQFIDPMLINHSLEQQCSDSLQKFLPVSNQARTDSMQ